MKPIRTCIFCRNKFERDKCYRIVSDNNGKAIYDKDQKKNTRGIYVCKSKDCIDRGINLIERNKILIKISVNKDSLINELKNIKNELGE